MMDSSWLSDFTQNDDRFSDQRFIHVLISENQSSIWNHPADWKDPRPRVCRTRGLGSAGPAASGLLWYPVDVASGSIFRTPPVSLIKLKGLKERIRLNLLKA